MVLRLIGGKLGFVSTVGNPVSFGGYNNQQRISKFAGMQVGKLQIKLAGFLYWDVEVVAYLDDNEQECVKSFYHEVQSAKPVHRDTNSAVHRQVYRLV